MVQQVWQPPFIYVPALGGFGVMNCDGEWERFTRDAFLPNCFWTTTASRGDKNYFERGVAAAKSGFIMMYCPENPTVKKMWGEGLSLVWIRGLRFLPWRTMPHGGRTSAQGEGMGVFTIYDWGNGAASEAGDAHPGSLRSRVYRSRPAARPLASIRSRFSERTRGWDIINETGQARTIRVVFDDGTTKDVKIETKATVSGQ